MLLKKKNRRPPGKREERKTLGYKHPKRPENIEEGLFHNTKNQI